MSDKLKSSLNLTGKLLDLVMNYEQLRNQRDNFDKIMKTQKELIIEEMEKLGINKAKSQLYSVSLSKVKQQRLSNNKLKEELEARGLIKIYNDCLYDSEYLALSVRKRKAGENLF